MYTIAKLHSFNKDELHVVNGRIASEAIKVVRADVVRRVILNESCFGEGCANIVNHWSPPGHRCIAGMSSK